MSGRTGPRSEYRPIVLSGRVRLLDDRPKARVRYGRDQAPVTVVQRRAVRPSRRPPTGFRRPGEARYVPFATRRSDVSSWVGSSAAGVASPGHAGRVDGWGGVCRRPSPARPVRSPGRPPPWLPIDPTSPGSVTAGVTTATRVESTHRASWTTSPSTTVSAMSMASIPSGRSHGDRSRATRSARLPGSIVPTRCSSKPA